MTNAEDIRLALLAEQRAAERAAQALQEAKDALAAMETARPAVWVEVDSNG